MDKQLVFILQQFVYQYYMPKKLTFVPLPLYSIATFKNFIYFSGGGGGKTGIPNQIFVFQHKVSQTPLNRISTGTKIYENLTISHKYQLMACSANENLLVFKIIQGGKGFAKLWEIQCDRSFKNPTINSICFHFSQKILAIGGDDSIVRFYELNRQNQEDKMPELIWEHDEHRQPIRKIDAKEKDLFVSNDTEVAVVINLVKKQVLRKFYRDELQPMGSVLQSAYFFSQKDPSNLKLLICHYIPRKQSYLTRELQNSQLMSLQISKDQSCATANSGQSNYLGLACGQGTTYLIDTQAMKVVSECKGHQFVITTGTVTRGRRFITGTSSCSYLVQEEGIGIKGQWNWLIAAVLVLVFVALFAAIGPASPNKQLDSIVENQL